jgi:hypothetical protein
VLAPKTMLPPEPLMVAPASGHQAAVLEQPRGNELMTDDACPVDLGLELDLSGERAGGYFEHINRGGSAGVQHVDRRGLRGAHVVPMTEALTHMFANVLMVCEGAALAAVADPARIVPAVAAVVARMSIRRLIDMTFSFSMVMAGLMDQR